MKMRLYLFYCCVGLLFYSCTKTELETVPDNVAPPDPTIETVTIENYVTRTYILTLGREPSPTEFNAATTLLISGGLDSTSRAQFLSNVFSNAAYLPQVYAQNKIDLLNNSDTAEFTNWITIWNYLLTDTTNSFLFPFLNYEIGRMTDLQSAFSQFSSGSIGLGELHRRMCNNYIYDQINMGSANFVITTFQHLLNRNQTNAELTSGISMVDGGNAIILLQAGASKNDYLNILTHSNNYYEAQIVLLYQKYLNRAPNTQEMNAATLKYSGSNDYTLVQKDLLATNEFIGI